MRSLLLLSVLLLCTLSVAIAAHHHRHRASDPVKAAAPSAVPDYYKQWCGGSLEYLNDGKCIKAFPSSFDREWACPMFVSSIPPAEQGWAIDTGNFSQVQVDTNTLAPLIGDADMCVILIRRTQGASAQVYYKYLCGPNDPTLAVQTWSSSKIYASANAGGHIREQCAQSGMTSATTGKHGTTPLGDLVTIIASYDTTQNYTSNSLSSYMHDVGGRDRIQAIVQNWFPTHSNLSLGGNYGEPTPSDLGFQLTGPDGSPACSLTKTTAPPGQNELSMLAHADMLRRLALHRDIPVQSRFPQLTWADAQSILYGAETSDLFPGLQWGGMTADTAVFAQSGLPMDKVESDAQGQWRIHSKMGAGWSSTRDVGEILSAVYAALPVYDASGVIVPDRGTEFVIVGRSSVDSDSSLVQAQKILQSAFATVVAAIYAGKIQ